jgi:hypothetical protein
MSVVLKYADPRDHAVCDLSLAGIAVWNPAAGMDACLLCCQVEVSKTGRTLVQRSPTEGSVSEYNLETSAMRRPRLTRGCRAMKKNVKIFS